MKSLKLYGLIASLYLKVLFALVLLVPDLCYVTVLLIFWLAIQHALQQCGGLSYHSADALQML